MEWLRAFSEFEFFHELMILLGAILVLIAVLKILGSSIKLLGWVALAAIGVFAVMIGTERSGLALSDDLSGELRQLVEPGKELSVSAISRLCARLPDN